jgi:GGDEF domain-containing protein
LRRAIGEACLASPASPLTASIGVAAYPDHSEDGETLLAVATNALDHAQKLGGNRVWNALHSTTFPDLKIVSYAV